MFGSKKHDEYRHRDHPGERTSHAADVSGDELIIYGGLRKVDTYLWDGSTIWDQLDDVWVFDWVMSGFLIG